MHFFRLFESMISPDLTKLWHGSGWLWDARRAWGSLINESLVHHKLIESIKKIHEAISSKRRILKLRKSFERKKRRKKRLFNWESCMYGIYLTCHCHVDQKSDLTGWRAWWKEIDECIDLIYKMISNKREKKKETKDLGLFFEKLIFNGRWYGDKTGRRVGFLMLKWYEVNSVRGRWWWGPSCEKKYIR